MNSHVAVTRKTSKPKQSGAATIMVILMIGVGLVAVSVGTMHTMRSTQERQQVAHAQVNAQSGAWAAVEVARQYLGTLKADQLKVLGTNSWSIIGTAGLTQSVKIVDVSQPDPSKPAYRVNAQVSATATAGGATSTIEVVYEVTPGAAPDSYKLDGVLDFYNDLDLSGGIILDVPDKANFNVDGDFKAKSIGISGTGLGKVSVTGDVDIDSAVTADEIIGRNVEFVGSAAIKKVQAFGNPDGTGKGKAIASLLKEDTCCGYVKMTGGAGSEFIHANGNADLGGTGVVSVMALRDVSVTQGGGTYTDITAGGNLSITGTGGTFNTLAAIGNITLAQGTVKGAVKAHGTVTCTSTDLFNIQTEKTITGCKGTTTATKPAITLLPPVEAVKMIRPIVDAWALKGAANYVFEFVDGALRVTVKNINGIADGVYYLARGYGGWDGNQVTSREYLCKSLVKDASGALKVADDDKKENICAPEEKGSLIPFCSSDMYNQCFTVDPASKSLKITKSIPPGVVWIKGNLELAGTLYNTFIVTGKITSSAAMKSYALNYAAEYKEDPANTYETSKNAVCKNEFKDNQTTDFLGRYPTNYCNAAGVYTPSAVGNVSLLAGGYDPDVTPRTFSGGDISLGSSNRVYGTIIAGDMLTTGGDTKIYGYVSGAGLMLIEDEAHKLGNATEINLKNLPSTYKPEVVPNMSGGGGAGVTAESKVLWTRYL